MFPRTAALLLLSTGCYGLSPLPATSLDDLEAGERSRVDLGRALFFDPGLSGTGDVACASCHVPELYGADARPTSVGTQGAEVTRNAPSVLNASLKALQFWDGRATTLEEQALGPLYAPDEMGQTPEGLTRHVEAAYGERMATAFPDGGSVEEQVASALAAYQRTLPSPSRYDRHLEGDDTALTDHEKDGLKVFRRRCSWCHGGVGLGGDKLRMLGTEVAWPDPTSDRGRFDVTGDPDDDLVFVVPSLRNVAQTAPYFHDGSVETLEDAVRLMDRHQLGNVLSDTDVDALVAFMGALDAERLPSWAFPPE